MKQQGISKNLVIIPGACLGMTIWVGTLAAAPPEPGWAKQIVPIGQERVIVKSTPVELRPYRPLHFYGNSVRRRHYRGTSLPAPRDVLSTATSILSTR